MTGHRLQVDWTRCDGHGLCSRLLPERVSLDEHGFPVVDGVDVGDELLAAARLTVRSCPAVALRLERRVER